MSASLSISTQAARTAYQSPGERFQVYWEAYVAAKLHAHKTLCGIAATVADIKHPPPHETRYAKDSELVAEAHAIVATLANTASVRFSPQGANIPINTDSLIREFVPHDMTLTNSANAMNFSPRLVWHELEKRLGGAEGHLIAYRACAETIKTSLGLRDGNPKVREARGRIIFRYSIWCETSGGKKVLGVASAERFSGAVQALSAFLFWTGEPDAAGDIRQHYLAHGAWRTPVELRRLDEYGPVFFRTFVNHIDIGIDKPTLDRLRVFVSKYGDPDR